MALSGNEVYDKLKKSVISQKRKNKLNPTDLHKLASLLPRWKPNDRLPVCLLCRYTSKKPTQRGHIFPHSVLKEARQYTSFDLSRGTEAGISRMGYYAFCGDCEIRFKQGEDWFNPHFFKKLFDNPQEKIQVGSTRDLGGKKFPWLYYTLIAIIWRSLCFIPASCEFIKVLELFRNYLLDWEASKKTMDRMVKLFLFAPNSDINKKLAKESEVHRSYFYSTFHTEFSKDRSNEEPNARRAWVFCGPLHVVMIYSEENFKAFKSLVPFMEWETLSMLTNKNDTFTIGDQDSRIFPVFLYDEIVAEGSKIISCTTRLQSADKDPTSSSPVVKGTHLHLLPRDVSYDVTTDKFEFSSDIYKERNDINVESYSKNFTFVKAKRGNEKILFVAVKGGLENGREVAMGLNVDPDGKVSYMKDVYIPQATTVDLKDPPFKDIIEKMISTFNV